MSDASSVRVPLVGAPPWLSAGVAGTTALSSAAFVLLFAAEHATPWLGLFPGLTVGVFAASALSAWARRRGGAAVVEANPGRLDLVDAEHRRALIDLGARWAAVLLVGRDRRMLVLSQQADPVVLLEARGAFSDGPPAPEGPWAARARHVDLDGVPLGASSAHVFALAAGATLDPLLNHLTRTLEPDAPFILQNLSGGERLRVDTDGVTLGDRAPLRGAIHAAPYVIRADGGSLAALGLASAEDEGALLLVACDEVAPAPGSVATESSAEAMLPAASFALLKAVADAKPGPQGAAYR